MKHDPEILVCHIINQWVKTKYQMKQEKKKKKFTKLLWIKLKQNNLDD